MSTYSKWCYRFSPAGRIGSTVSLVPARVAAELEEVFTDLPRGVARHTPFRALPATEIMRYSLIYLTGPAITIASP